MATATVPMTSYCGRCAASRDIEEVSPARGDGGDTTLAKHFGGAPMKALLSCTHTETIVMPRRSRWVTS